MSTVRPKDKYSDWRILLLIVIAALLIGGFGIDKILQNHKKWEASLTPADKVHIADIQKNLKVAVKNDLILYKDGHLEKVILVNREETEIISERVGGIRTTRFIDSASGAWKIDRVVHQDNPDHKSFALKYFYQS
jgi:hypothetical protein